MLQEYYLIRYKLVYVMEVAVKYIQRDRIGVNTYQIRIEQDKTWNIVWSTSNYLKCVPYISSSI